MISDKEIVFLQAIIKAKGDCSLAIDKRDSCYDCPFFKRRLLCMQSTVYKEAKQMMDVYIDSILTE